MKLILENNVYFFNDKYYSQLKGTARLTKISQIYATLDLGFLENFVMKFMPIMILFNKTHLPYRARIRRFDFIKMKFTLPPGRLKMEQNEIFLKIMLSLLDI